MWRHLAIKLLMIIALASVHGARKHWKRAPVHGVFNVDVYAYNKPLANLAGKQATPASGQALPMGQLLEQLSHISRRALPMTMAKAHYRNLDTDNYMVRNQGVAAANATTDAAQIITQRKQSSGEDLGVTTTTATETINSQLAEQQLNSSLQNSHAMRNLYSHEFHVQHQGNRKIVWLNTLRKNNSSNSMQRPSQDHKPVSAEVVSEQTQPLNLKLAMPALEEKLEEQQPTTAPKMIENGSTLEMPPRPNFEHSQAISTLGQMESLIVRQRQSTTEQPNKSSDSKQGAKDANNMTTIEAPNTANAYDKEKQLMPKPADDDDDDAKKSDRRHDNDGQANGIDAMPQPESVAVADKPLTAPKSKRKQTKSKTKKRPNEIDTKPTTSSSISSTSNTLSSAAMLMVGTANVKAPVKESPEISTTSTHAPTTLPLPGNKKKSKGKGKRRKGSQRRPSQEEQEIETTTNWWQILPYAEIRKFLNTIYDSIAEDDDDRRLGRHHDHHHPAQRI